jgi:hypothetical protein
MEQFASTRINPTGEFPEPLPIPEAAVAIGQFDSYTNTPTEVRTGHDFNSRPRRHQPYSIT